MTTYTTTAIATNSVDNTVTIASINNMFPGLPITFSGVTFGGITEGSTYYIAEIIYGYPTSRITLSSLPGGAIFALTTATGSMTANWSSGGQLIIDTAPPGESLNSAFTKINTNFDQIWAAGPVNSNVKISNNTIYTLDTNGDLILNPNGIGNVVANAHVIPDTTRIRNLGSPTKIWNELYVKYLEVGNIAPGELTIPVANLHILGGNAGTFLQTDGTGNLDWALPIPAAAGNNTTVQFNNNGVLDGVDTFTYDSTTGTITLTNINTTGVANLNSVSNVVITGGVPGYVLTTDGSGNLAWTAPTGNVQSILDQQFFGDGSTVNFGLSTPSVTNAVIISINGVLQIPNVAYTVSNDVITFTEAPLSSDLIDIRFLVFGQSANSYPSGADGFIQFNSAGSFGGSGNLRYISATGNLYSSNVTVSGNVTASYYYGNGSQLTGITATANTGTITFSNNTIGTSNANAAIDISGPQQTSVMIAAGGNSAVGQMLWATNISALSSNQLPNGVVNGNTWGTQISVGNTGATIVSNSVSGLKTWTFKTDGTLSSTGSIIAGSLDITDNISAVGNITGNYILGNVAFATGIPQSYGDGNVYALLDGSAADIIPLANVSYSLGNATNQWKDLWVSNSTIYMNNVPITLGAGNVLSVAGNAVVTGNELGNIGFTGDAIYDPNGIVLENASLVNGATAALIIPSNGNTAPIQLNNIYGDVLLQSGQDSDVTASWRFNNNGNVTLPGGGILGNPYNDQPNVAGLQAGIGGYAVIASGDQQQFVQADNGNVYIGTAFPGDTNLWTFDQFGNITLPSNIASINYANGQPYGGTGGANYGNADVANLLADFGSNTVSTTGTITSGNISADNVATANVDATGNVTAGFFVGDGRYISNISLPIETGNVTFTNTTLTGPSFGDVPSANSSIYIQPTVDSANVFQFTTTGVKFPDGTTQTTAYAGGTYGNSQVAEFLADFGSNTISTTGNVSTGNVTATGTSSNVVRRAFGLVAADTYVTLDDISANVSSSTSQLGLFTSGSWQGTGWTETFQGGGTPTVQSWVNLPLSSGFGTASGAMNSQGNGCRCIISDQTPSAKVYQITVVRSGTSGALWNISIERLV